MLEVVDSEARDFQSFIRAHTSLTSTPLLPEIKLYLATEMTPLWWATETWLAEKGIEPPFWAFAWAGGQAIARYILDEPKLAGGQRILDIASGSGLCAIAAARAGANHALAIDRDAMAAKATELNAEANGVVVEARAADIITSDTTTSWAGICDIVLAGDVCYDAAMTAAFLPWLQARVAEGIRVFLGDPGRYYLPKEGLRQVARYRVPASDDVESAKEIWSSVYEML